MTGSCWDFRPKAARLLAVPLMAVLLGLVSVQVAAQVVGPIVPPAPLLAYCAPPVPPACIDMRATFASKATIAACQAEADGYVAYVFKYRECLTHEMERAVLETNQTIQRFRCAEKRNQPC